MMLRVDAEAVLDFIRVFVDVDPIQLWRHVRDGANEAFVFGVGVGEEISREWIAIRGWLVEDVIVFWWVI